MKAIKSLKSGKAAGPDGIPPEVLKADVRTSTDMLHPLLVKIWETEAVPEDWKASLWTFLRRATYHNATIGEGSCSFWYVGKCWLKLSLARDSKPPWTRPCKTNMQDSVKTDPVRTTLPRREWSLNNPLSGSPPCTASSWISRRYLTAWTGRSSRS